MKNNLKISNLLGILEDIKDKHGDLQVGHLGHFGEFFEMDSTDVGVCEDAVTDAFSGKRFGEKIVEIHVPNIGPDPD